MNKLAPLIIGFYLLLIPLVGQTNPLPAKDDSPPEEVSILLKWHHQFQFAGIYAAQKQGFFRQEGLKVKIHERDLTQNNIRQVLSGKFHYGISDSILLLYQLKGEPVKILAAIMQHSPQVLVTLKSSGIDSPFKLQNRRMAFYEHNTDGFPILAMLETTGIKPNIERIVTANDPDMLFTSEAEFKQNPERVQKFKRAILKGWQYALDNKEEMVVYIKEAY